MISSLIQKKNDFVAKLRRFATPGELYTWFRVTLASTLFYTCFPMTAMAGADEMFGELIGFIFKIFFYIGALLLAWSIGQLIMAFKNEDADSKSRAGMVLVVSVILLVIGNVYDAAIAALGTGNITVNHNVSL